MHEKIDLPFPMDEGVLFINAVVFLIAIYSRRMEFSGIVNMSSGTSKKR